MDILEKTKNSFLKLLSLGIIYNNLTPNIAWYIILKMESNDVIYNNKLIIMLIIFQAISSLEIQCLI